MRRALIVSTLLYALTGQASAGTLTLSVATAAGTVPMSVAIADADLARIIAAGRGMYGQVPVDPAATPVVMRDMTDQEVIKKIADNMLTDVLAHTDSWERMLAAQAASKPIVATPQQ